MKFLFINLINELLSENIIFISILTYITPLLILQIVGLVRAVSSAG